MTLGSTRARAPDAEYQRVAGRRLAAQQIARHRFTAPADLVAWMGAVQAQDPAGSRWAVALRLGGRAVAESTIARALAEGTILRTHVMRWTWQLIAPADLHWMLPLVAGRLVARAETRHRALGLEPATFRRSAAVLDRTLGGGAHLTRAELGAALRNAGIAAEGPRLSHLLGHAELEGLICGGAPRAKQATWALVVHRAPRSGAPRGRQEALAELARRYFRSRGPATAADFAWWSGLQPAEARAGLAAVQSELASELVNGVAHWWHPDSTRSTGPPPTAVLLPPFDEYLVAYRQREAVACWRRRWSYAARLSAPGGVRSAATTSRSRSASSISRRGAIVT